MVAEQRIIYARYLLPIVPMLCILAAAAVISGVSLLRRYQFPRGVRTALIAALTLALLAPPALDGGPVQPQHRPRSPRSTWRTAGSPRTFRRAPPSRWKADI